MSRVLLLLAPALAGILLFSGPGIGRQHPENEPFFRILTATEADAVEGLQSFPVWKDYRCNPLVDGATQCINEMHYTTCEQKQEAGPCRFCKIPVGSPRTLERCQPQEDAECEWKMQGSGEDFDCGSEWLGDCTEVVPGFWRCLNATAIDDCEDTKTDGCDVP